MLGLGSNISKTGKLGVHDLGIVTSNLVLKHNYDLSSVQPLSDGAASFNGTSDYITMGDVCDIGSSVDFSIALWVYLPEATSQYLISKYVDANNFWYVRTQGADQIQFYSKVDGSVVMDRGGGGALSQNTWHHVALTVDRSDGSTGFKIYYNGVLKVSGAASVTDLDNSGNLYFGRADANYTGGYMCNVGIWNAVLTQAQIKSIMWKNYAGLTSSETADLVSWWNLDTAYDSSVFDNHHNAGDTLGSELITNGSFTGVADETDVITLSGWAAYSTPTSRNVVDNKLVIVTTGANQGAKYIVSLSSGTYKLSVDVTGDTGAGGIYILTDSSTTYSITTSVGTVEYYFYASSSTIIYFRAANNLAGTTSYTNISVKLVNGNSGTLS